MPWAARGKEIIKTSTGEVVGHSKTHVLAAASVRARYAHTRGERLRKIKLK